MLTDVANLVGVSLQNLRGLMLWHPAMYPVPVHEGNPSIWHLATILQWLADRAGSEIDSLTLETDRAAMQVNIAREARQLSDGRRQSARPVTIVDAGLPDKPHREWHALVG